MIHEFEALLYSDPDKFIMWFPQPVTEALKRERELFTTPEHIDDDPEAHPSKRIIMQCENNNSNYQKATHGTLIALDIGLQTIRSSCKHFDQWINNLEALR